jgi:hypothetical protein
MESAALATGREHSTFKKKGMDNTPNLRPGRGRPILIRAMVLPIEIVSS